LFSSKKGFALFTSSVPKSLHVPVEVSEEKASLFSQYKPPVEAKNKDVRKKMKRIESIGTKPVITSNNPAHLQ
jgi:hypothetical protein